MPTLLAPPTIDNDVTRRDLLAALAATGLLTGCAVSTGSGDAAPTRTVVDGADRTVDIPTDPQRVVVIDANRTIVNLVALGVEPVGATTNPTNPGGGFAPTLGEAGPRIRPVGTPTAPDVEQIAALAPDLIITAYPDAVPIDQLGALAPTLVAGEAQFGGGLFTNLRWVGEILGRQEQAAQLEQEFLDEVSDGRPDAGLDGVGTVVLFVATGGYRAIAGTGDAVFDLVGLLGAVDARPEQIGGTPLDLAGQEISDELIGDALADARAVVLVTYLGAETDRDTVLDSPLFQAAPAVAAGRIAVVDAQESSGNHGLSGLGAAVDDITRGLGR